MKSAGMSREWRVNLKSSNEVGRNAPSESSTSGAILDAMAPNMCKHASNFRIRLRAGFSVTDTLMSASAWSDHILTCCTVRKGSPNFIHILVTFVNLSLGLRKRERLTMYVCWRHRQLRTLLDQTEDIGQLMILLVFWIDIGYE
jgi:hypothetical protein